MSVFSELLMRELVQTGLFSCWCEQKPQWKLASPEDKLDARTLKNMDGYSNPSSSAHVSNNFHFTT